MLDFLILLALAVFFFSRLKNVLGKTVDDDMPSSPKPRHPLQEAAEKRAAEAERMTEGERETQAAAEDAPILSAIANPDITEGLAAIKAVDHGFSVKHFLTGSRMAFEMILKAYHEGDKATLKPLLSKEIMEDFAEGMSARAGANRHEESTLVSIKQADVVKAAIKGKKAEIAVRFVSEQISVVRDQDGNIVEGDPSKSELVTDEWVFMRDVSSSNPNWILIAT